MPRPLLKQQITQLPRWYNVEYIIVQQIA